MFLEFLKKNKRWEWLALGLIISLAFAVRFWNFGPWLYFEADQARDANIIKAAVENGPGYLPLLGPRAAGTFLRLGPAEYYFQYLAALLFGSYEPFVLAYPALLFSLLSIPLFYFFLKQFFSRPVSLSATAVWAFSFILIQYSRFAWNPNGLPFWSLLFIFSIFKTFSQENQKKAGLWLLAAAVSYGIASQLHFLALVGLPLAAVLFWIFYFPKKIKLYFWVAAVAVVLILYLPMFLSELSTGGDNFKQFKYALTAKTGGEEEVAILTKARSDLRQVAIAFSMLTTSFGHKDSRIAFYFGVALWLGGLGYGFWSARKDKKKKAFFWLLVSWLAVYLFLYVKTSTSLKPRFFFSIAAVPFLFLAYGLDFLAAFNRRKKIGYFLAASLALILVWANLDAVNQWYAFLKTGDEKSIQRKMFLKQSSGITLEGLKQLADYMAKQARLKNRAACYDGIQEYKRTLEYLLEVYYPDVSRMRISNGMKESDKRNCLFFSFAQVKTGEPKISSRHSQYFASKQAFEAAGLAVWDLTAREEFYLGNEVPLPEEKVQEEISQEAEIIDEEEEISQEVEEEIAVPEAVEQKNLPAPPRRKERVYWKDVFNL